MIPKRLTYHESISDTFIQEFRSGARHIICIADQNHPLLDTYAGIDFHFDRQAGDLAERLNFVMEHVNAEGFVAHFYNDTQTSCNFALSVLPQLVYSCDEWPSRRNDYYNRPFISRCIKEVFNINRNVIHAPKITFIFEHRNFNVVEGIELMYHHATSNLVRKDRNLIEISYLDPNEPDVLFL